jgi:hypothetical protein
LPAEVFIDVGEGITLEDIQLEHLFAARIMLCYAEIVQLIHKNRQELHNWMKRQPLRLLTLTTYFGEFKEYWTICVATSGNKFHNWFSKAN